MFFKVDEIDELEKGDVLLHKEHGLLKVIKEEYIDAVSIWLENEFLKKHLVDNLAQHINFNDYQKITVDSHPEIFFKYGIKV